MGTNSKQLNPELKRVFHDLYEQGKTLESIKNEMHLDNPDEVYDYLYAYQSECYNWR